MRIRSSAHAEDVPHFAGILSIQRDRVVRGGRTIVVSASIAVVGISARVHDQSFLAVGALDRQGVGMRMTWLIVGTDLPHIKKESPWLAMPGDKSRVGKISSAARKCGI